MFSERLAFYHRSKMIFAVFYPVKTNEDRSLKPPFSKGGFNLSALLIQESLKVGGVPV